jgi:hypothetical protein
MLRIRLASTALLLALAAGTGLVLQSAAPSSSTSNSNVADRTPKTPPPSGGDMYWDPIHP